MQITHHQQSNAGADAGKDARCRLLTTSKAMPAPMPARMPRKLPKCPQQPLTTKQPASNAPLQTCMADTCVYVLHARILLEFLVVRMACTGLCLALLFLMTCSAYAAGETWCAPGCLLLPGLLGADYESLQACACWSQSPHRHSTSVRSGVKDAMVPHKRPLLLPVRRRAQAEHSRACSAQEEHRRVCRVQEEHRRACRAQEPAERRNMQGTCRAHAGHMQGTCREHAGNMQGTCRAHAGNMQGTCREHAGNMQGTCRAQEEHSRAYALANSLLTHHRQASLKVQIRKQIQCPSRQDAFRSSHGAVGVNWHTCGFYCTGTAQQRVLLLRPGLPITDRHRPRRAPSTLRSLSALPCHSLVSGWCRPQGHPQTPQSRLPAAHQTRLHL